MLDLASLTNDDGSIPRGNWLYIVCGLSTIVSGYFSGPPILISPESAGGIKAGAKTGLSTLVCGLLYVVSIFFCPMFAEVPPSGTSPLLILVGMLLFMNVGRINWNAPGDAVPAFFNILLIPFSYSIMCGVGFGYLLYFMIGLSTGVHVESAASMMNKLDYTWRERQPSDGPLPYVNNYSGKVSRSNSEDKKIIEIADEPKLRIEDITDFSYQESGKSSELDRDFGKGKSPSTRYSLRSNESAVDDGDTTASQRITRNRNGSVVDQLPMDLDSGIQSLNF